MAPASRAVPSFLGAMIVYFFGVLLYEFNCRMYIFLFVCFFAVFSFSDF